MRIFFINVKWHDLHIFWHHVCEMSHSCVWRDSFRCETWLMHPLDVTRTKEWCHACQWCQACLMSISHIKESCLAYEGVSREPNQIVRLSRVSQRRVMACAVASALSAPPPRARCVFMDAFNVSYGVLIHPMALWGWNFQPFLRETNKSFNLVGFVDTNVMSHVIWVVMSGVEMSRVWIWMNVWHDLLIWGTCHMWWTWGALGLYESCHTHANETRH